MRLGLICIFKKILLISCARFMNRFKNIFVCTVLFGGNNQVECISCVYTLPRPFLFEAEPEKKKKRGKKNAQDVFNINLQ